MANGRVLRGLYRPAPAKRFQLPTRLNRTPRQGTGSSTACNSASHWQLQAWQFDRFSACHK